MSVVKDPLEHGSNDAGVLTSGWIICAENGFTAAVWAVLCFLSLVIAASDWIWVRGSGVVGFEVQKSWLPLQLWWGKPLFPFHSVLVSMLDSLFTIFWLWSVLGNVFGLRRFCIIPSLPLHVTEQQHSGAFLGNLNHLLIWTLWLFVPWTSFWGNLNKFIWLWHSDTAFSLITVLVTSSGTNKNVDESIFEVTIRMITASHYKGVIVDTGWLKYYSCCHQIHYLDHRAPLLSKTIKTIKNRVHATNMYHWYSPATESDLIQLWHCHKLPNTILQNT